MMIPESIATSVIVIFLLCMVLQIVRWQSKPETSWPPSPPPLTQKQIQSNQRWDKFWNWIEGAFIGVSIITAGLVFFALLAFGLVALADVPLTPMNVVIILLTLILFKMCIK